MVSCLLIDNNPAEREKVASLLAEIGVQCAPALPRDAEFATLSSRPDFVFAAADELDLEWLDQLKGRHAATPVVIVYSGTPDVEAIGRSIALGVNDFLLKPFDRDLLKFKLLQAGVQLN
jgi:two-component system, chemotaxis family, chemotaxis protein CheY